MALSKGAQAVRAAGFKSLKHFREVSLAPNGAYARGAALYARAHFKRDKRGKVNLAPAFSPTGKFARLFGKAMFKGGGIPRKRPHRTYLKLIERDLNISFRGPEVAYYPGSGEDEDDYEV